MSQLSDYGGCLDMLMALVWAKIALEGRDGITPAAALAHIDGVLRAALPPPADKRH